MLTTLSILSSEQGKMHSKARGEAEYFASFAKVRNGSPIAGVATFAARFAGRLAVVPWVARMFHAHHAGR